MIAFASDRGEDGTNQIWSMTVGMTSDQKPVVTGIEQITFDSGDKSQPTWSPDGKRLLYVAPGSSPENGLDLWILDITDPNPQPFDISNRPGDELEPDWAPDGSRIAYVSDAREDGVHLIFFVNPDGSNRQRVSKEYDEYSPVWSPDMHYLFFILYGSDHLTLMKRERADDFTAIDPYDPTSHFGRLGEVGDPEISPDMQYIAYTKLENSITRIQIVDYQSGGAKISLLSTDSTKDKEPSWSPDSQWIVFTSERDGNSEIYIMTQAGLSQTNLTTAPGKDFQPAWQP